MKLFITHQRARSFGAFAYRKAKQGRMTLVTYAKQPFWLGHAGTRGFYLVAFDASKGQSEQLAAIA